MKIGEMVQHYIPKIFEYCVKRDHEELYRLYDKKYSKDTLDVNYPFCKPVLEISDFEKRRYWRPEYAVLGISVRVTSQWFDPPTSKSRPRLVQYLARIGIDVTDVSLDPDIDDTLPKERPPRVSRGRYKGNAIGNAQNLAVRNILSNLGAESFGPEHWEEVKDAFGRRCAYCGQDGDLLMDHVVPINRSSLGEHRLGNLVPSCSACNAEKGDKDFRDFLSTQPNRIAVIEAHMERHNYVPIGENDQIRQIIDLAHKEVAQVAGRYIAILNTLMAGPSRGESDGGLRPAACADTPDAGAGHRD